MNDWLYDDVKFTTDDIGDAIGFVYRITNTQNGMDYIGKKNFWRKVTKPPLKGKKRKRRSIVESDWQGYHGSSNKLLSDIDGYGYDAFNREILCLCTSKSMMSYIELWYQMKEGVLFSDMSYNGIINIRINSSAIKKDKEFILNETK